MGRSVAVAAALGLALVGVTWFALSQERTDPEEGPRGPAVEHGFARIEARLLEIERRLLEERGRPTSLPPATGRGEPGTVRSDVPAVERLPAAEGASAETIAALQARLERIEEKIDALLLERDTSPPPGLSRPVNQELVDDLVRQCVEDPEKRWSLLVGWSPGWVFQRLGSPEKVTAAGWRYVSTVRDPSGGQPYALHVEFSQASGRVHELSVSPLRR